MAYLVYSFNEELGEGAVKPGEVNDSIKGEYMAFDVVCPSFKGTVTFPISEDNDEIAAGFYNMIDQKEAS